MRPVMLATSHTPANAAMRVVFSQPLAHGSLILPRGEITAGLEIELHRARARVREYTA